MTPVAPTGRVERILAGVTLMMFAEAFLPRLLSPDPTSDAEPVLLRYLWLPFYGLILGGLVLCGRRAVDALLSTPLLVALCLLAIASTAWSIDPDLTIRRSMALLATTLFGVYLAVRFTWSEALGLLGTVWALLLAASLISGLAAPDFAIMTVDHPGAWSGGWWEKNQLGGHASRASFLFAFLAWRDPVHRRAWIAALVVAVALVALSRSATSLLGVLLGAGVILAALWMRRGKRHTLVLLSAGGLVLVVGGLALLIAPQAVFGLIGRDASLTGRTDIWIQLLQEIGTRPWLGFGYLAFWGDGSEPRYWLQQAVAWDAPTGHQGWLDLAVSLGWTGVILLAADMAAAIVRSLRAAFASPVGVFAVGAILQLLLFSLSESILVAQNSITWATYALISVKLAMESRAGAGMREYSAASVGGSTVTPASRTR